MRNFKRFLSMILTVLMVAGCLSVFASASFFGYDDLEGSDDYSYEIGALNAIGVMQGKTENTFGYKDGVTRRQMAILVARVMAARVDKDYEEKNFKGDENITPFTDLDAKGDYYGAISLVSGLGIVKGTSATTFDPNSGIMYRDALTMIVRALGYDTKEMGEGYPWSYVFKAEDLGLTDGLTRTIGINEKLTRAEVAKLIFNALFFVENSKGEYLMDNFGDFDLYYVTPAKDQTGAAKDQTMVQEVTFNTRGWNGSTQVKAIEFGTTYAVDSSLVSGQFGEMFMLIDIQSINPLNGRSTWETTNLGKVEPKTYTRQKNEFKLTSKNNVYTLSFGNVDYTIVNNFDNSSDNAQLLLSAVFNGYDYVSGSDKVNDTDGFYKLLTKKSAADTTLSGSLGRWQTSRDDYLHSEVTAYDMDFDGKADFVVFNRNHIGRALTYEVANADGSKTQKAIFSIGTANFDISTNATGDKTRAADVLASDIVNKTESAISNKSIVIWEYDNVTGKVTVNNVIEQNTVTGALTGFNLTTKEIWIDGQKYPLMTYGMYGAQEYKNINLFGNDLTATSDTAHNLNDYLTKKVTASLFNGSIVYMENVRDTVVTPDNPAPNYLFDKVVRFVLNEKDATKVDSVDIRVLGTDGQYSVVTVKTIDKAAFTTDGTSLTNITALTAGSFINVTGTNVTTLTNLTLTSKDYSNTAGGAFLEITKVGGVWRAVENRPYVNTGFVSVPERIIVPNEYGYNVLDLSTAKDYAQFYTTGSYVFEFGSSIVVLNGTSEARSALRDGLPALDAQLSAINVWNQSADNGGIYAVVMYDGTIGNTGSSKIVANLDGAAVDTYNYYYDNKALDYDANKGGVQKTGFYAYMRMNNNSAFGYVYSDTELVSGSFYTLIKVNGNLFVDKTFADVNALLAYVSNNGDFTAYPVLNGIG